MITDIAPRTHHSTTYRSMNAAPRVERLAQKVMGVLMGSPGADPDLRTGHPSERDTSAPKRDAVAAERLDSDYVETYARIATRYRGLANELLPGPNHEPHSLRRRTGVLEGDAPVEIEVVDTPAGAAARSLGRHGLVHKEIRTVEPYGQDGRGRPVMRETRYYEHPTAGALWYGQIDHVYGMDPDVPVVSHPVSVTFPFVQDHQLEDLERIAEAATWDPVTTIPDPTRVR